MQGCCKDVGRADQWVGNGVIRTCGQCAGPALHSFRAAPGPFAASDSRPTQHIQSIVIWPREKRAPRLGVDLPAWRQLGTKRAQRRNAERAKSARQKPSVSAPLPNALGALSLEPRPEVRVHAPPEAPDGDSAHYIDTSSMMISGAT